MRRLMLAMGTLALFACGDSTGVTGSINGTYSLQTVNGAPLPFTIPPQFGDTFVEQVTADVITASNGSFTNSTTVRDTDNTSGQVTISTSSVTGTYVINGTAVTFNFQGGGTENGSISGNTITIVAAGLSLVYTR